MDEQNTQDVAAEETTEQSPEDVSVESPVQVEVTED